MELIGKYTETLKEKAIKEANEALIALKSGIKKKMFEKTQLSWRIKRKKFFGLLNSYKNADYFFFPEFDFFEIKAIKFHTPVMIDVIFTLNFSTKHFLAFRMLAEKKAYVTDPSAPFRFNPNSIRIDNLKKGSHSIKDIVNQIQK